MDEFEVDDLYVGPGMPWQQKLLIGIAVLQLAIIGLQVSIITKTPDEPYIPPSSDVDLSPITSKLDELKLNVEAARSAAADAGDAARGASSDISKLSLFGVQCKSY